MARIAAPRLKGTIRLDGPFFTKDPGATVAANVRRMMDATASEAEADLAARIPVRSGRTKSLITGRTRSRTGRRWAASAVIGIPKDLATSGRGPVSTYAAMANVERRYHPVRATVRAVRRLREANVAELLRDLD